MKNNMLNSLSMNDVMAELARSADLSGDMGIQDVIDNAMEGEEEELYRPMTETESFCAIDSLCAELYSQLLESRDNLLKIIGEHGDSSAMAEIARDMMESAETSLEVRLIELRDDEETSGEAGNLIMRVNAEIEKEKEEAEDRKRTRNYDDLSLMFAKDIESRQKKKRKTDQEVFTMAALFVLWMQKMEARTAVNGVKNDFGRASREGSNLALALLA